MTWFGSCVHHASARGLTTHVDHDDCVKDEENDAFVQLIKQYEDKNLKLVLYNTKKQCFRGIDNIPDRLLHEVCADI